MVNKPNKAQPGENRIYNTKPGESALALFANIRLHTIIGGEEGDEEGGKPFDEEINLRFLSPARNAAAAAFMFARLHGIPFEKAAVDALIHELRELRGHQAFDRRKKKLVRGRPEGSRGVLAARVAELHPARTSDEICTITWSEMYPHKPKPRENSGLWKEHKKRVADTIYNLTMRPSRRKRKTAP